MKLKDSSEFIGKRIFLKHDEGWIEGILESIEENGVLLSDIESYYDDDGEKEETTTYFILHHHIVYLKYSPHAYYDDDR